MTVQSARKRSIQRFTMDKSEEQMPKSSDGGGGDEDATMEEQVPLQNPPQITNAILSQAVLNAISHMDTKLAFDMLLLSEQMTTLDSENKCLKDENVFLKDRLATQTREQHEMYHYFHGKLDQHVVRIASLEQEVAAAKDAQEQAGLDHGVAMETTQSSFEAEIARANSEIESLRHELRQLHVFSQQKLQIESQVEALTAQLAAATKQFEEEKLELERKNIFEKDRVKKEMLVRMKETKEALLLRTDDQLNTTTKRTMMENEHCMDELAFQSKETEKLLTRFHLLEDEVKGLRVKTKMLEENEAVLAKKTCYYQKILQKLQKKDEKMALDGVIKDEKVGVEDGEVKSKSNTVTAAEEEIKLLKTQIDELEGVLRNANDWIHVFQQEKQYLIVQQDEIIEFLCRAIHDATREMRCGGQQETGTPTARSSRVEGKLHSGDQIARMAKETTKMDELVAWIPPIALDELSSEETRFVLQFLLEKMKIYQQRISFLFQNASKHPAGGSFATGKHRDLLAKQLGVELPPIANAVHPSASMSSTQMSPLKQKRRMFAQVSSSVAAAMEGEPSNQKGATESSPAYSSKPPGANSLQPPHTNLLAMATSQFNFLSSGSVPSKSPLKSSPLCAGALATPSSYNSYSTSMTRSLANGSPVKHGGMRKVQPPGNTSAFAKKHLSNSSAGVESTQSLLQSQDLPTAWSSTSIPTLADVEGVAQE